ncbi:protein adenylyltransferase SelO family protein [Pseudoblastomonas halimionae]|uniref:Protein nucleotidyltransferase YdiU n=1 Tax=Alteriqipengyuania halimionae TaxID=1926630 RepID=A0A6I4U3T5_9SPHN|nr:YdiU family protein [Alteriqipengyuania halimionae]MXP08887.1 YdiU family protein [Alteriqipengyuania halimionae]
MRPSEQPTAHQPAPYRPDPQINALADWLASPVAAADFPQTRLRFANRRAAETVGLQGWSDDDFVRHLGRFEPLDGNLEQPLALAYHGHQFRVYNPDIGDGRGFLFAQLRDRDDRLLDLGTKGSGTTPYSRSGDGRLTLKGAVREILATEMLEALGVNTSRTFAVIETGEQLERHDEPSPTRSAVLTRLSHGHIRIGTFQRLALLEERDHMAQLVDYCLAQYPGPLPPDDTPGRDEPAVILLHQVVERLADTAAGWMVAGFVHGVLNTDNMNISGESFDYGPWRFLPRWDASFVAAYFDHGGLYAFGRQPEAVHWNCMQLAVALRTLSDSEPLIAALDRYGQLYEASLRRRWIWRLGLEPGEKEDDTALIAAMERRMVEEGSAPDRVFARYRLFDGEPVDDLERLLAARAHRSDAAPLPFAPDEVPSLEIERVEEIWAAIDRDDDWSVLEGAVAQIRRLGEALGPIASSGDRSR